MGHSQWLTTVSTSRFPEHLNFFPSFLVLAISLSLWTPSGALGSGIPQHAQRGGRRKLSETGANCFVLLTYRSVVEGPKRAGSGTRLSNMASFVARHFSSASQR